MHEQQGFAAERHFASVEECLRDLPLMLAERRHGDDAVWAYRGESRYYPSTSPSTLRHIQGRWTGEVYARIDATEIFAEDYEDTGGSYDDGQMLGQHYLLSSDGVDFSRCLNVALAFAVGADERKEQSTAYLAVLDASPGRNRRPYWLHDLGARAHSVDGSERRESPRPCRPTRQAGLLVMREPGEGFDLKSPLAMAQCGLTWFSVAVTPDDVRTARHPLLPTLDWLYAAQGDTWATKMLSHLTRMIWEPSPVWGDAGLRELKQARMRLLDHGVLD